MRTLIAVPCMDEMDVGFVRSLVNLKRVGDTAVNFVSGSLIYQAREQLAAIAVDEESDYVLWLDSDMVFPSTLMLDLIAQDKDIITGVCAARRAPYYPCIYRNNNGAMEPILDFGSRLIEVDSCGFAVLLMKTHILEEMFNKYNTCFQPVLGYGEDFSFCLRAKEMGYKIWADPNIEIGHIGKTVISKNAYRRIANADKSEAGVEDHNNSL